ncbi:glycosyltransferase family 9 protein [Allokutzneria sp. A3M-2-11 16]|uniref:glycosyltransferase family 9 protein n=1 Tax=Allokutzneria sp. A3M-2-11 16 TaxID=2962043 RepID=UPI0020B8129B|nr:glycosyltransferase family 9 protein [Allokutzneria sp. A3M-2-11 16]MCP3804897.1 glycosyltransferase family 9 protein [Allokutzneria sp. A3M-2-11 16]
MSARVLVARLDSDGDVLLAGPAIRAAATGGHVTLLCGPSGYQAAELLPGVTEIVEWACPWIVPDPPPVDPAEVRDLVEFLAAQRFDVALILTSFHQSSLPLALLLRLAGVPRIVAASTDYPGSLLDTRLRQEDDIPEAQRALQVAEAAGFALPDGDDGLLRVKAPPKYEGPDRYVVLHPGASVPARAWAPNRCAETVVALAEAGHHVVVTGSPAESELTALVAGDHGVDLGGRTTLAELAGVLAGAEAVVVGNTGPAHLAAAVGTPVVSLFSPVVPASRWAPYGVPVRLLGDQWADCRGTRARECPIPGHPCLNSISPDAVVAAVDELQAVTA